MANKQPFSVFVTVFCFVSVYVAQKEEDCVFGLQWGGGVSVREVAVLPCPLSPQTLRKKV